MWLICHTTDNEIRTPHFEHSREDALRFVNGMIKDLVDIWEGCEHKLNVYRGGDEVLLTMNGHTFMWRIFQCSMEVV